MPRSKLAKTVFRILNVAIAVVGFFLPLFGQQYVNDGVLVSLGYNFITLILVISMQFTKRPKTLTHFKRNNCI